ncbi:twin-arginine translocase subunit TatC [Paenibacillus sp. GCM10027629]|uniref:twin-arginine translocase subunit TatC n=1 Tax=Paenibacillus sp. GCM10027629 TaxID=3273414 RepID=UPI00362AF088
MPEKLQAILQHIGDLRRRLIWIIAVLFLTAIIGLFISQQLIAYLRSVPPGSTFEWNAFSPWDAIKVYMNVTILFACVITLPFTLFQLWKFVKPGLRKKEQQATLRYIPFVCLMLIVGLAFAYFVVFPMAFKFTTRMTVSMHLIPTYGVSQYFGFMFSLVIPVSLAFELPVLVMFLTKLRILNPKKLHKFRRYAYFILVIVATMISPPELISHLMVAIPLLILYEISVGVSSIVYRKQLIADEQLEADVDEQHIA